MFDISNIINTLNFKLNINLSIKRELVKKNTARSLKKYILVDKGNNKYLLEIAINSTEIFYFKRTIKHQEKLNNLKSDFELNLPLHVQNSNSISYAIYSYFDNVSFFTDNNPIEKLNKLYDDSAIEIKVTSENINKILLNFLSIWPNQYHGMIQRQEEFQNYKQELENFKTLKVCYEHGDFTTNNIFNSIDKMYLVDFEFARGFQPIGFDIYDYETSLKKGSSYKGSFCYKNLHLKKYLLIEKINKRVDLNDFEIEIYDNFDDKVLIDRWNRLYSEGADYNLSYDWCKIWAKHFIKPNQNIFIFTIWDKKKLVFLAPLYENKKNLHLIGSDPDLFDNFSFLYKNEKHVRRLYNFIFKNNYNIDFRYLDANGIFAKNLIKYLYQNKINYESKVIDTKPKVIFNTFKMKKNIVSDVKRCRNRAIKNFGEELKFNFSIEKDRETLSELISFHKEKWNGGPFENIKDYDLFIKEISETDLVLLSKLSVKNKTVAYHLAYKDSNNILNSAIPSYNNKYNDISPGKVLLYEILNYCNINNNDDVFDFGRGAEGYKYWFSNESSVLFHIKTHDMNSMLMKAKIFIDRIFNKLNRAFNA